MNTDQRAGEARDDRKREPDKAAPGAAVGTEAEQKGGKDPAKLQAERDWENSAKESGE